MKPVIIQREARWEAEEGFEYYERLQEGLGLDLKAEIETAIGRVHQYPSLGSPYKSTEFRFQLVRRFP